MKQHYAYWKTLAWRLVRGAAGTAIAQTLTLQVDWSEPKTAMAALAVSFLSGFLMALGLAVRDFFSDGDKSSLVQKLPV